MIYVDRFGGGTSGKYWLESFRKIVGDVEVITIGKTRPEKILERILQKKPKYLHFGGSVKREGLFPVRYVETIRKELPKTRFTFFYGDPYYFSYQRKIIPHIDKLIITHKPSDIDSDKVEFLPCPTVLSSQRLEMKKIYEVSFVGNNYSLDRCNDLIKISRVCDLTVFGNGWENTGLKFRKRVSFDQFPKIVGQSKFCLGTTLFVPCVWSGPKVCELGEKKVLEDRLCHDERCLNYKSKYGYFSNRVMNLCGCGACILILSSDGLRDIFTNEVDIMFFDNLEHLRSLVLHYKNNVEKLVEIGSNAHKLSRKYTFDRLARRLLYG
jgi:hypothetical protein